MVDDNRTLPSGMSLPQWMKNRMNDRLNFEHSTFSPPSNDDNFLYIPYSRIAKESNGQLTPKIEIVSNAPSTAPDTNNKTDFSKHTAPCKQFISEINNKPSSNIKNSAMKIKSNGADDGFKGEAAACGSSVIRVAHQMVTGKLTRGFTTEEEEFATPPPNFNPSLRRASKSLPSSPLASPNSSPKSKRRLPNRYFASGVTDADKIQGSWILSGLLRKNDYLSRSVSVINEEPSDTLHKTISEISIDDAPDKHTATDKSTIPKVKPNVKPSQLREMNFWSPTSM